MKTKSSILLIILFIGASIAQDSLAILKYDPKLGLDMKGLINSPRNQIKLIDSKIDEIIANVKNSPIIEVTENDIVFMETSVGKFTMKLFPDIAPEHCKNFKRLANSGFYDLTAFHRVIPGFMIQGGDILSRDFDDENDGTGGPGWTIDAEFNNYSHKKGVLSMARSSDPNSAGSQFFICVADAPHLDGKYTVFGEVTSKIHVIDRIAKAPTGYSIVKINSKKEIPIDEDPENWVTLKDPKTGETIYSKIPNGLNENNYRTVQQKNLYSDKPMSDVLIKKVRVNSSEEK